MGTQAAPNLVMTIIDLSSGNPDSGETVEIVPYGSTYPTNKVVLSEIGVTGRYKKETAPASPAVAEGAWKVYVGAAFRGIFLHGGEFIETHLASSADPHGVSGAQVAIADSGNYFSGSTVEAALQEIGAALAGFASSGDTLLTDVSDQSVASGKPKVTNLDADSVDGAEPGTGTGNIPLLHETNVTGKLNTSLLGKKVGTGNDNIPQISADASPEAGKVHDSVLGKKVGIGDDNIPQISTDASPEAGKVHDTILAKKVGTGNDNIPQISTDASPETGKVHDTILGKKVGIGDDNIPQISTDASPEAGKVHDSFLGIENSRRAVINDGDSPTPDEYGAGAIWAEIIVLDNTDVQTIDDSIDWRDRLILMNGYVVDTVSPANALPGGTADEQIRFGFTLDVPTELLSSGFYSEAGRSGVGTSPGFRFRETGSQDFVYIWVDSSDGSLKVAKMETTNGTLYAIFCKIEYSPDQGHYS